MQNETFTAGQPSLEPAPSKEDNPSETVPLSYAEPLEVVALVQSISSPTGKVTADQGAKAVILNDSPDKITEMKKAIKEFDVQRFTMVFTLTVAKAAELEEKVQGVLTKNVGKVKIDEKTNKLIIIDTPAKIEEVRKIVDQIDRRDRQVLIEAKVVHITLNDEHRTGVDWEAIVSDYRTMKLTAEDNIAAKGEKRGQLSIGTIANEDYAILIEALDTVGTVEMLSNPSITAMNNKEVRILAGTTQPYVTADTPATSAGTQTAVESTNFMDVGVKLFVTPTVHADGAVTMRIRPEISSVSGQVSDAEAPTVETSQAQTTIDVKDGVTIVIGGLIKEEKSKLTKKVPILGDVPFLGMAFRSYVHNVKKTEIVIFLKPKISAEDVKQ